MNRTQLLEHFDRISEAPDAVARLRRFILDLAVRGKLVEQDAYNEPAAELLKRIQAEKARLVKEGSLKKAKPTLPIRGDEQPFSTPMQWQFVRLGDVLEMINGRAFKPTDWLDRGLPIVRIQNLNNVQAPFNYCDPVTIDDRHLIRDDEFLISWSGTPGTSFGAFIWRRGLAALNQHIFRCIQIGDAFWPDFLCFAINSQLDVLISKAQGGVGLQHVTKGTLEALPLPLPPLAEQHRIVAKVDELMALCDQLQAAQNEREARRDRLVAASLHRIVTIPAAADEAVPEAQTASRFHLDHLPRLTTRPEHIKQLRHSILNLAVRGRLVPQDPNDEPAAELLKRLQAEKARSQGRNRALPIVDETERPFKEPSGWLWTRLGDVLSIRTGFAFKSSTYSSSGTLVFRVTNFDREGSFDLSDSVYFPSEKIDEKFSKYLLQSGEIIMVMVGGTIGKTTIVNESILPALLNQNMWRIRSFGTLMSNRFEYLLVKNINQSIQGLTQSTHGHFAMSDYELKLAAIPPLAEQHRIVAKVDELMALCDQLEAQLTTTQTDSRRLLEAVLNEALAAAA